MTTETLTRPLDLQRFCADENDPREYLQKPWRDGGWVYATNGHLVLRIPDNGAPDTPERTDKHPAVPAMFRKYLEDRACEFLVMPSIPEPNKCTHCGGAGFVWAKNCPDCVDGEFTHGDYGYDCKNCMRSAAGPGKLDADKGDKGAKREPCAHCDFNGYPLNSNGGTQIGTAHYATVYLWTMAQLPECRVCPGDPARESYDAPREAPAAFIFDGGQALLMPRRP